MTWQGRWRRRWSGEFSSRTEKTARILFRVLKPSREQKDRKMRLTFQLKNGMEVVELAGYENEVAKRQAHEKEKAGKLQIDTEMRVTELTVRGLKRKAFRKETAKEKADRS